MSARLLEHWDWVLVAFVSGWAQGSEGDGFISGENPRVGYQGSGAAREQREAWASSVESLALPLVPTWVSVFPLNIGFISRVFQELTFCGVSG